MRNANRMVVDGISGSCSKVKFLIFASCWVINRTGIDLMLATTKPVYAFCSLCSCAGLLLNSCPEHNRRNTGLHKESSQVFHSVLSMRC